MLKERRSNHFKMNSSANESQQNATQIEFNQAMEDFKTMFPSMDLEVIETVLRANKGAVDATVDQLLAITKDTEHEKLRTDQYSSDLDDEDVPLHVRLNWKPPLLGPLPHDFLSLGDHYCDNPVSAAIKVSDLALEDERFAILLQNEEFMTELRKNQEFLSSLNSDSAFGHPGKSSHDEDTIFKEKLRHMGKVSKKKFSQMARVFTGKKKKKCTNSPKSILNSGGGPGPSKDNVLLTQDEHSTDS